MFFQCRSGSRRQGSQFLRTPQRKTGYNLLMLLAVFALRLLEVMFFVGLAGSAVVVLISFIEDARELIGEDEKPQQRS